MSLTKMDKDIGTLIKEFKAAQKRRKPRKATANKPAPKRGKTKK